MPGTTQLTAISEMVDRIGPLAGKQPGMPIEADDWNTLVDVLRGVLELQHAQEDTAQSSLEQHFAPQSHDHLGQVTTSWLEPSLQTAVTGVDGGVTTRAAIALMQQQVSALNAQLAGLSQTLDLHQKNLDRFAVNDVDRARALAGFDARFAGVENLRTLVTGMSSQVNSLASNVATVLDLRKSLTDANGAPIDIGKIQQNVGALQKLADNLNGVDGTPVRIRDVQLQIKEISDAVGVGGTGGLDARLAALSTELEARLDKKADDRATALHAQLLSEQNARADQSTAQFEAAIKSNSDAFNLALATSSKDTESRLTQSFTTQLTATINAARDGITAATSALVDQRMAAASAQTAAAITAASADLRTSLERSLSDSLHADLQTQVGAAEQRLNTRVASIATDNQAFQTQMTATTQTTIQSSISALGNTLATSVSSQITQAQTTLQTRLDTNLTSAIAATRTALDQSIASNLDQRLSTLNDRVSGAVSNALQTLPQQIGTVVDQRLTALDVSGQIGRSTTTVAQQLRSEFSQAINDLQGRFTTATNGVLTQLRGEISVAARSAADDAVQRASALVSGLRDEVGRTFVKSAPTSTGTTVIGTGVGGVIVGPIAPVRTIAPPSPS
jgi:hypothetical protein